MWETVLVVLVVVVCAFFIGRRFYNQFKGTSGCGCSCSNTGCSGTEARDTCCDSEKKK